MRKPSTLIAILFVITLAQNVRAQHSSEAGPSIHPSFNDLSISNLLLTFIILAAAALGLATAYYEYRMKRVAWTIHLSTSRPESESTTPFYRLSQKMAVAPASPRSDEFPLVYECLCLRVLTHTSSKRRIVLLARRRTRKAITHLQKISGILTEASAKKRPAISQPCLLDILMTIQPYYAVENDREVQARALECFNALMEHLNDSSMEVMVDFCEQWIQDSNRPVLRRRTAQQLLPLVTSHMLSNKMYNTLLIPFKENGGDTNGDLVQCVVIALKEAKNAIPDSISPDVSATEKEEMRRRRQESLTWVSGLLVQILDKDSPYPTQQGELSSVAKIRDWKEVFDLFAPSILDHPQLCDDDVSLDNIIEVRDALDRYVEQHKHVNGALEGGLLEGTTRKEEYEAAYTVLAKLNAALGRRSLDRWDQLSRYKRYAQFEPREANRYRLKDPLNAAVMVQGNEVKAKISNINPIMDGGMTGLWLEINPEQITPDCDCSKLQGSKLTIFLQEENSPVPLDTTVFWCNPEFGKNKIGVRMTVTWNDLRSRQHLADWLKNHVPWVQ